jgi:hypothetical protein
LEDWVTLITIPGTDSQTDKADFKSEDKGDVGRSIFLVALVMNAVSPRREENKRQTDLP